MIFWSFFVFLTGKINGRVLIESSRAQNERFGSSRELVKLDGSSGGQSEVSPTKNMKIEFTSR
jgi:hypothetical protein